MEKGLFGDSGVPTPETFLRKLSQFNSLISKERSDGGQKAEKIEKPFMDGNIVYLPKRGKAFFVGDLHGDFEAVVSVVTQSEFLGSEKKPEKNTFLVFLGDYGDRGKKDVATIHEVISLKLIYPDNVILLRGNHEEFSTGAAYGTLESMINQYGRMKGEEVFRTYTAIMAKLPAVVITENGIVGVHGGIPNEDIQSIKELNGERGESLVRQMTWNDPSDYLSERSFNSRGGDTTEFGKNAFARFMNMIPVKVMVRAHQYPRNGFSLKFDARLATIFSNGSEKSYSSGYKHIVERAVFLAVNLTEPKNNFVESDFIEINYSNLDS